MLIHNPKGHYHFLKGIDPYSSGVIADPEYEIVHVTLTQLIPWREGFTRIDAYLKGQGVPRTALCGIHLRCPTPFTMEGFIAFNRTYCEVLREWGLYVDELNPLARTNVAPLTHPPKESMLYGFSYIRPSEKATRPTFIVRRGETHAEAMQEKAAYVMKVMEERLLGLGGRWDLVNRVNIYTAHSLNGLVETIVLPKLGDAQHHGLHWYQARPPIVDIEYEMDMRGVAQELYITLL
ncbi:RidA family protein [Candidatus Poribacteria bacterium]|nr:RidA family protein [Candidatus Poribacteria bacterium]